MRVDLRDDESKEIRIQTWVNNIELEGVIAFDTEERWIVRELSPEEIVRATNNGETFMPGVQPVEQVYLSRGSTLKAVVSSKDEKNAA